jgi:hypothetical protein
LVLALVAIPFLVVRYPPITDLPQHAAQIRLFGEALSDPQSQYQIQWLTPYGLSFVVLGACWLLAGPAAAGRIAFMVLALLWVGSIQMLAARRNRSIASALLASVFVFSHVLYWGFYSFIAGFVLFCVWIEVERSLRSRIRAARGILLIVAMGFALYLTHALWFAAAAVWLAAVGVLARLPWRQQTARLAGLAPPLALAL